jgi:hypothetical protein
VPDPASPEAREFVKRELYPRRVPILELTHNHGTESTPGFAHANGNEEGRRGFGHLGFLVPDVYAFTENALAAGVPFHKLPDAGAMKGLAFAKDPVRRGWAKGGPSAARCAPRATAARSRARARAGWVPGGDHQARPGRPLLKGGEWRVKGCVARAAAACGGHGRAHGGRARAG